MVKISKYIVHGKFISGKIITTTEENINLQKLFLNNGFKFLNGRTEPHLRENLDYFYFENSGIISVGSKNDSYNNRNIFNLKFWTGDIHFKKKKLKKYEVSDFL